MRSGQPRSLLVPESPQNERVEALDVVDSHCHVIAEDIEHYPVNPIGGKRSGWSASRPVTFERFADLTEQSGVQQAVLVQSSTTYTYDNSYVADCVARNPTRFVGVCTVDGLAPDVAETLSHWIHDRNMSGVRFYTPEDQFWLDKPEGEAAWRAAANLQIPVCVSSKRIGLPLVRKAVQDHPDVPVLLDHMLKPIPDGGEPFEEAKDFFELAAMPNVFLKFTNVNVNMYRGGQHVNEFLNRVVERFGLERIMWGSNFPSAYGTDPINPYGELVNEAREMLDFLDGADREQIFSGTARTLYPALNARATGA